MILYAHVNPFTKVCFLWHGKNKTKHQTLSILTIQVLDAIPSTTVEAMFCTIENKEYYSAFQRHSFTLQNKLLKYMTVNR